MPSMSRKMMNVVLLSCKKAAFLIDLEQENPLTVLKKVQLKMHLSVCKNCSNYEIQSRIIGTILKNNQKSADQISELHLAEEVKTRIQKEIQNNLPEN